MSETNVEEQIEKQAALVVDLDSLDSSTTQEEVTIDSNADPFQSPPPPPDGIHRYHSLGRQPGGEPRQKWSVTGRVQPTQ